MKKSVYSFFVIIAGILWGSVGIFVRSFSDIGLNSLQTTGIRLVSGTILMLIFVLIYNRKLFKISIQYIPIFLGTGILSILLMSCFYFAAIVRITMSASSVLLYTAPIWVVIAAAIFYGERIDIRKGIALLLAFAGCVAVSGFSSEKLSVSGILFGLGSGLAYALYSIIGKLALKKYPPITVTLYSFIIASVGILFVCKPFEIVKVLQDRFDVSLMLNIIGIGFVTVFAPYLLYTAALNNISAGKASIMASVEPISATVFGMAVYKESLGIGGALGILLVMLAICILNLEKN